MFLLAKAAMFKPKRGGNGASQRERGGSREGAGREKRVFFSPLPIPPFLLSPSHLPLGQPLGLGLLFLLSPIFHCHKIKDGGYNNASTNKVSPTQNTPALQAIVFVFGWLALLSHDHVWNQPFVKKRQIQLCRRHLLGDGVWQNSKLNPQGGVSPGGVVRWPPSDHVILIPGINSRICFPDCLSLNSPTVFVSMETYKRKSDPNLYMGNKLFCWRPYTAFISGQCWHELSFATIPYGICVIHGLRSRLAIGSWQPVADTPSELCESLN